MEDDLKLFSDEEETGTTKKKSYGNCNTIEKPERETLYTFLEKRLVEIAQSVDTIDELVNILRKELDTAKDSRRVSANAKAELAKSIAMLLQQKISFAEKSVKMKREEETIYAMSQTEEKDGDFSPVNYVDMINNLFNEDM